MAESTELMTVDNICNRVYIIRGQQVMLDYDLAELYGYEVKALNQQVKRNIDISLVAECRKGEELMRALYDFVCSKL